MKKIYIFIITLLLISPVFAQKEVNKIFFKNNGDKIFLLHFDEILTAKQIYDFAKDHDYQLADTSDLIFLSKQEKRLPKFCRIYVFSCKKEINKELIAISDQEFVISNYLTKRDSLVEINIKEIYISSFIDGWSFEKETKTMFENYICFKK